MVRDSKYEGPPSPFIEQRGEVRARRPQLPVTIHGNRYKTVDWSASGFRIEAENLDHLSPGEKVSGTIGSVLTVPRSKFVAVVVRASEHGAAFVFNELRPKTFLALRDKAIKSNSKS